MKLLLEAGADPNRADWRKATPLHDAVVKMLLDYGASTRVTGKAGHTPFTWAAIAGKAEAQRLLEAAELERGQFLGGRREDLEGKE